VAMLAAMHSWRFSKAYGEQGAAVLARSTRCSPKEDGGRTAG
jgi:hypothetical protein